MSRLKWLGMVLVLLLPNLAHASWWNTDWTHRKKITVNAPAAVKQPLDQLVVPVRLHTGNFPFTDAKEDGADLRFIAGDDKTPLKFHMERFDGLNELAIVWVQLPKLVPGAAPEAVWMYYGNAKTPAADDAKATFDQNQTAVLHFNEKDGLPKDATAYANNPAQSTATLSASGLMGGGAGFNGQAKIVFPATPSLKLSAAGGFTFSAWIKSAEAQKNAVLFSQTEGSKSITIGLTDGRVVARFANGQGAGVEAPRDAQLAPGAWHHLVVTAKENLVVYVDGKQAAAVPVALADIGGETVIGVGFKGDLDEVAFANVARPAEWVAAAFEGQGAEGKLLTVGEPEEGESEGASYFSILLRAVTLDGWVVIGILMVMMVVSFWVMFSKAIFVIRMERANEAFRMQFKKLSGELVSIDRGDVEDEDEPENAESAPRGLALASVGAMAVPAKEGPGEFRHSSLYRVYHVGVRELQHRFDLYKKAGRAPNLSSQAIDAIKASLDSGLVRELHRLNGKMVLLTIAISGGPFLGLLGTVVGVMITFAAIAAVGDVNINSIAPGIAAALVATVAGLGVAIPALFGYNYLASRIKNITTDMQIFVDEFITKLAEDYAP